MKQLFATKAIETGASHGQGPKETVGTTVIRTFVNMIKKRFVGKI